MVENDLKFLTCTIDFLKSKEIKTWIFGGWAKELLKVIPPREHRDIDLLYVAENFNEIDQLLKNNKNLVEIPQKRKTYKRAFLKNNIMIEIFLVKEDENGYFTPDLLEQEKFYWPSNTFDTLIDIDGISYPVASIASLESYSY